MKTSWLQWSKIKVGLSPGPALGAETPDALLHRPLAQKPQVHLVHTDCLSVTELQLILNTLQYVINFCPQINFYV